MNRRDLLMITGIAVALLAAVSAFEMTLKGVPSALRDIEFGAVKPSLSVRSRSNVRAGDSTSYRIVGKLQAGESAPILGVSARGAGWFYIELPDGTRGFIAPDIVITEGDLTNLVKIDHGILSPTATPLPATAVPTQPEATAAAVETESATPTARG